MSDNRKLKLTYTNWRGETAERTIVPLSVWYGSTEWHPEPQWLLKAYDMEKGAQRDFALADFGHRAPSPAATVLAAEMQRRAVERAKADAEMCMESAAKAEAEGHDSAADQDRQAAHVARGIAAAIRALPLPGDPLPAALRLPEVRALVEAVEKLGLRKLVAGWNGEDRDTPYTPHPSHLWAKINTTCGVVYEIDAALAHVKGETA